ncbi:sigma-54-dependent Fis family transcriptional regulator [Aurantimonas sp. Leaf443]|uniref:sigma-54-dependent Fis family transcriptional regulator n=1 Tax=Aurantimonas sp. Leaf443 TaxID=1736378 RepID=UPI0007008936|nr:sigma-54-dependent Fis family transcriptional regulator [Aurantimonas sp. Leaf443]KQT83914.1 AAA family ATPase [Aurantimonas sp. Leaf443]
MGLKAIDHIREVEAAILGKGSRRDAAVTDSWQRCVESHRLDPSRACEAYILPEFRLREHRDASEDLIRTARSGLETLHRQMAGQGYVLILADAKGVAVDFLGDPTFDNQLRKAGLYLGAEWSEPRAGTCAVGACIATGEALTIHQSDHFDVTHTPLTCSAAPIYDEAGQLTAILDISALRSPEAKISQTLVLHMVSATARRIELANLMARARGEWVLRFSQSPEFLDVDPEGAVAIDGSGRITGLTHAARRLLSASGDAGEPVLGRPFSDFFQFDLDDLPALTRGQPTENRLLTAHDGACVFAHAIAPQTRLRARRHESARPTPLDLLSGGDPAMDAVVEKARKLCDKPIAVFIEGETGTGKERLARALHDSRRGAKAFVAVNCAALPEGLIEAELFGHAPGAFTGAGLRGRKGLIEAADGGTLFLDEIGDMPFSLQSRLLRVLSEREVVPVGGLTPVRVDLRVVSATHQDLGRLVREGRFREDLYYRLNAATLRLPPLRERADLDWLIDRLLAGDAEGGPVSLEPEARAALHAHDWPGNIRELCNAVALGRALCSGGRIARADLPDHLSSGPARLRACPEAGGEGEAAALRRTLEACGWNVSRTARHLGVDRTTVHRRMARLGLAARH